MNIFAKIRSSKVQPEMSAPVKVLAQWNKYSGEITVDGQIIGKARTHVGPFPGHQELDAVLYASGWELDPAPESAWFSVALKYDRVGCVSPSLVEGVLRPLSC